MDSASSSTTLNASSSAKPTLRRRQLDPRPRAPAVLDVAVCPRRPSRTIEAELELDGAAFETVVTRLLDAADQLDDRGLILIGPTMRSDLARYDDVIRFMHGFFAAVARQLVARHCLR